MTAAGHRSNVKRSRVTFPAQPVTADETQLIGGY
jgi:hypothetical protein